MTEKSNNKILNRIKMRAAALIVTSLIAIIFPSVLTAKVKIRDYRTTINSPQVSFINKRLQTTSSKTGRYSIDKITFQILGNATPASSATVQVVDELYISEIVTPELVGVPLNYPNPFSATDGTRIGYMLTMDMDMHIRIYDIFGHEITRIDLPAGTIGGMQGYNKVPIGQYVNTAELSAGVYFYIVLYEGKVVGKGKMGVLP